MQWLSPVSLLWLGGHLLMVIVGVIFVDSNFLSAYMSKSLAEGIGGSLIAAGIAGEILYLYVRLSENTRLQLEILTKAGIKNVFPYRSVLIREEYETRLKDAREIDILGFGLSSLREDYGDKFRQLSTQARLRIVVLDPDFPSPQFSFAGIRDKEEKNNIGQIKNDVLAFEELVRNTTGLIHTRFKVKRLQAIPSINIFRIDDVIFWGPYLLNRQSRNMPTLIVHRGGFLFDQIRQHFECVWEEFSVPVQGL